MSDRFAEVIILAEDERSGNLLRRYVLRALNLDNRRIRQQIAPSGKGDAKQWVLGQYSNEVSAVRKLHRKTGLVVHLDADTDPVNRRANQLAAALKASGQDGRESTERVSHAIPRRETETWLCVLTGVQVDEETDCKRKRSLPDFDAAVQRAALKLYEQTRANAPAPGLPSLATAISELQRLEA
ncbi:MAG TPA: hypothetical protein VKU82_11085 [Planctomycetaceae bacterium]|nr:hypothetical protein [Planctomycetaceae bacterium]